MLKKREKKFFSIFQIFMNIWKVDSIFSQELLAAVKKKKDKKWKNKKNSNARRQRNIL